MVEKVIKPSTNPHGTAWAISIDEGLMIGWFANAMMAKHDIMIRRMSRRIEGMPTLDELEADGIIPIRKEDAVTDTGYDYLETMLRKEKGQDG